MYELKWISPSLFLILLNFIHCDDMPLVTGECPENNYVIYSILSPEYREQGVYVGKFFPYTDPTDVSDATVTIRDSVRSWQLALSEPGYYKINSAQLTPVPLTTYFLEVRTPDGQLFTAHTTIPDTFHVIWPAVTDTLTAIKKKDYINPGIDTTIFCSSAKGGVLFGGWSPTIRQGVQSPSTPEAPANLRIFFGVVGTRLLRFEVTIASLDSALSDYAYKNGLSSAYFLDSSFRKGQNISFPDAKGVFGSMRLLWHEVFIRNEFN